MFRPGQRRHRKVVYAIAEEKQVLVFAPGTAVVAPTKLVVKGRGVRVKAGESPRCWKG